MTDKTISEYEISETDISDSENNSYSESEISSENESMNTSDEEFIDNDESDESSMMMNTYLHINVNFVE